MWRQCWRQNPFQSFAEFIKYLVHYSALFFRINIVSILLLVSYLWKKLFSLTIKFAVKVQPNIDARSSIYFLLSIHDFFHQPLLLNSNLCKILVSEADALLLDLKIGVYSSTLMPSGMIGTWKLLPIQRYIHSPIYEEN